MLQRLLRVDGEAYNPKGIILRGDVTRTHCIRFHGKVGVFGGIKCYRVVRLTHAGPGTM